MRKGVFRDMKIGKKLILSYLLACLVPLLAMSLIIYKVSADNLEESSLEFASAFSSQIVTNIDDFIEEYDKVTKSILVDNDIIYELGDNMDSSVLDQVNRQLILRKIMLRLTTLKPEIKGIIFLTKQDRLYHFNTDGANVDVQSLKDQVWLDRIMKAKDNLTITSIHDRSYYDRNSDGITLTVGRQIFNNGGAYVGVLLIDLEPSSLISLSDGFLLARNNYNIKISITDAYNSILYDSDVASGRITWEEAQSLENPFLFHKKADDYLILTNETKRGGLKINAVIPRSDLLFKINKIGYATVFALLVCIVIVVIISSLFSRTITKPIRKMQQRMKQVEQGQYKVLLQKESNDEIGNLVTSYNHMVMKIKTLIEDVYIAEIKQKNAKFLALQTQINPHMLYNTLDSIRMKALVNGDDEVAEMIKILAKMFRNALSKQTTPNLIKDEVGYVENYVKLQNMRFYNMFSFSVDLEERILNSSIISMVLQPVIENSIEHGFKGYNTPLHIALKGTVTQEQNILLQISDDGKGMLPERVKEINNLIIMADSDWLSVEVVQEERETSIGLKNIAERIKLHYGSGSYLRIADSTEKGTVIEILIPG
ncbi:MAG: rane protein [Herbinix sp.]|nr:rane protein [Herbinix sp.]